jgi:hypothetical protein
MIRAPGWAKAPSDYTARSKFPASDLVLRKSLVLPPIAILPPLNALEHFGFRQVPVPSEFLFSGLGPLLQHFCSLPDAQPYSRPVLDGRRENLVRLVETAAGIEEAINFRAVFRPLLDFVEIALVRVERIVSLFDSPISSHRTPRHFDRHPTNRVAT